MSHEPDRLFVDVDTGIDDAFALLYACAVAEGRLVGVSTVVGNVSLANATRNTRAVLALAGRGDVTVAPGAAVPLAPEPNDARAVHGATGLGYASLPEPDEPRGVVHAVDALVAAARAHAGRLALVATGPLTNIALAVMHEPELPRLVRRFVIMGGAYAVHGNVTPSAEFNIWHDPEAARIVFRAFGGPGAAPVVAIGLDVTRQVTIDGADLAALAARCGRTPKALALQSFLEDFVALLFRADGGAERAAVPDHARPAGAGRRARSDSRRDAPRRRRRRDRRAADVGRDRRRLGGPLGPPRQHRGGRLGRRGALPGEVSRRDGQARGVRSGIVYQPLAFFARSMPSMMSFFASSASPQRMIFTHLPGSRSL